jgi:WD repeat-containing protein 68
MTSHHPSYSDPAASTGAMSHSQQYETPRRNRHPDELHMSASGTTIAAQRGALSPRDFQGQPPRINLDQASPGNAQYQASGQLPGALQPGRPGPMSSNTAPTIPTQHTSAPEYSTPSRSANLGLSQHNYTRSSPAAAAGFDPTYVPYSATTPGTDQGQFTSSPGQKYTPQSSQRAISNTPLGLADIRPRADSTLSEGLANSGQYPHEGNAVPTNSNYLAPWAIYAFDWCKWPAQSHEAGKVAVGSYLEDGHNFVG